MSLLEGVIHLPGVNTSSYSDTVSGEAALKFVLKKSFTSMRQAQHSKTVQEEGLQAALLVTKGELLSVDQ